MRSSLLPLLAALLCAPAYAAQADVPAAGATPTEAALPAYPAPPPSAAPAPTNAAAPAAVQFQASALVCRPAEGSADGRLMLCEQQIAPPRRGWGENAGMAGLTLGALALGVGFLSDQSAASGSAFTLTLNMMAGTGALVPVISAGSRSSRHGADLEGVPALRVFGWIAYAASFAVPTVMLLSGHVPDHPYMVIGALDATALIFHGVDALVAGRAERKKVDALASLEVAPYLGPVASADGSAGASLGFMGRY